jgi:hypothetical protein
VYGVLAGLVWGGAALAEAAVDEHALVMDAVAAYMAARPLQVCVLLCGCTGLGLRQQPA